MTNASGPDDPPAGLLARRPVVDDAPQILPLMVACDLAVLGHSDSTLSELSADLVATGVDNERGGWLVTAADGTVVGWSWTQYDEAASEVFVDLYSLDADILRWLMRQARAYVGALAVEWGRPTVLAAGSYAHDEVYGGVLRDSGLEVVRSFWQMRLALDPGSDRPPRTLPAGVTIRLVDAEAEADLHLLHRLHEQSFVDHWHHTPREFDDWYERFDKAAGRDPSQWWIAAVDREPAGLLIGSQSLAEINEGYVDTLGVLRAFRGRGVAKALLYHAFDEAARRGRTRVGLGVDSESPTGATGLYESVGMSVDKVVLAWQGTVTP